MKSALDIGTLAKEIERQQEAKADYITPTPKLTMLTSISTAEPEKNRAGLSELHIDGIGEYGVLPWTHEQIGIQYGIPKSFYDRLRVGVETKNGRGGHPANPALFDHTVNTLFRQEPKKRMVRTLDDRARAFVSNRYRILDNYDLAEAILPTIGEMDTPHIEGQITERKLYLKVLLPGIQAEIPKVGDIVQAGLLIQNSEVGYGRLSVDVLIYSLVCKNGMVAKGFGQGRYHVGRAAEAEEAAYQIFSDETLKADDQAFWLKVRDTVKAAADEAQFQSIVATLGETVNTPALEDVEGGVELVAKRVGLSEGEQKGVLKHLIQGGNLTLYGTLNAITRAAQDVESYDRSVELETIGGDLMRMPKQEWAQIARAS